MRPVKSESSMTPTKWLPSPCGSSVNLGQDDRLDLMSTPLIVHKKSAQSRIPKELRMVRHAGILNYDRTYLSHDADRLNPYELTDLLFKYSK